MRRIATVTIAVIGVFMGVMCLRSSDETKGVPVVVAEQNIAPGTRLSKDMVKVTHVPDERVVEGAYTDPALVVGQVTRVSLARGEQVLASEVLTVAEIRFLSTGGKQFSPVTMTLNVKPVTTEGEPVFAGDHVDILLERDGGASTTVVENVLVVPGYEGQLLLTGHETVTVRLALEEQFLLLSEALNNGWMITLSRSA